MRTAFRRALVVVGLVIAAVAWNLHASGQTRTGGGFVPDYTYSGIKFDNNAADECNIYCGATLIDKFAYSVSLATVSGHAFSLDPAHYNAVDNDNPADYCLATAVYNTAMSGTTTIRDYGTPGADNPPCQ